MQIKPLKLILLIGAGVLALVLVITGTVLLFGNDRADPKETTAATEPSVPSTEYVLPPELTDKSQLPENPLSAEDFAFAGDYLTCLSADTTVGVDVSFWQETVDWAQVRDAGMDFAMLRLGYRGTTSGAIAEDDYLRANYAGATDAGLQVGGYFFSQAITPEEAVEEAKFVLELIRDWNITMPIVYDWEYVGEDARTANMDARTLTDCTKAFCRTIEDAGYKAMIYFNEDQSHKQMYLEELTDYKFWLAQYKDALDYPYQVDMWQYTCTGSVPGIGGNVDINLFFDYAD